MEFFFISNLQHNNCHIHPHVIPPESNKQVVSPGLYIRMIIFGNGNESFSKLDLSIEVQPIYIVVKHQQLCDFLDIWQHFNSMFMHTSPTSVTLNSTTGSLRASTIIRATLVKWSFAKLVVKAFADACQEAGKCFAQPRIS